MRHDHALGIRAQINLSTHFAIHERLIYLGHADPKKQRQCMGSDVVRRLWDTVSVDEVRIILSLKQSLCKTAVRLVHAYDLCLRRVGLAARLKTHGLRDLD